MVSSCRDPLLCDLSEHALARRDSFLLVMIKAGVAGSGAISTTPACWTRFYRLF